MSRPWERLFIAAARLFAWGVVLTPFAVVTVLVAAALAGQQQPDIVFFLGNLVVQLFATLFVAAIGAGLGASVGIGSALLIRELLPPKPARPFTLSIRVLSAFPAVVLGWFGAVLVLPALLRPGGPRRVRGCRSGRDGGGHPTRISHRRPGARGTAPIRSRLGSCRGRKLVARGGARDLARGERPPGRDLR